MAVAILETEGDALTTPLLAVAAAVDFSQMVGKEMVVVVVALVPAAAELEGGLTKVEPEETALAL